MSLTSISRRARISLAAVAAGSAAVLGFAVLPSSATATPAEKPAAAAAKSERAAKADAVTRAQMLERAATWLTANNGAQVPYSQTQVWSDGYRQDCSGYVSMTL